MAKFEVQECPVCGNTTFSSFLTCKDFFVSGEEFTIKKCDECDFKITANIEDEENIGSYYQSDEYISHSNTSKGIVNSAYHRVRNYMLGQKRKLVERSAGMQSGHILDVGTGTGYFLHEMVQHGWQVTGTEKSSDARAFAKSEFNLEILETEELFSLKEKHFDAITLWHVLEHIHRLDENMLTFQQLLKRDGKLIIAVPNHKSYDARNYKQFWAAYDVPRHIWHFSPKQMKQFGEKHGFTLEKTRIMPFDSFYVSMLSEKYKKTKFQFPAGILHGTISWLLSLIISKNCSSVIYVFKKQ